MDMEIKRVSFGSFPVITEEMDREIAKELAEQDRQECLATFKQCGIGEKYYEYDLQSFRTDYPKQVEMLNGARKYFSLIKSGKVTNLMLTGNAGQGKTRLVVGLLRQLCFEKKTIKLEKYEVEGHYTIRYVTSKELCDLYRRTQSYGTDYSAYSFMRDYGRSYDVLAIDELGKSGDKAEWEILFEILDKRMQSKKSTIVVSNLSYDALNTQLMDYGMSRLNIDGNLVQIDTTGLPDFRQNKK